MFIKTNRCEGTTKEVIQFSPNDIRSLNNKLRAIDRNNGTIDLYRLKHSYLDSLTIEQLLLVIYLSLLKLPNDKPYTLTICPHSHLYSCYELLDQSIKDLFQKQVVNHCWHCRLKQVNYKLLYFSTGALGLAGLCYGISKLV